MGIQFASKFIGALVVKYQLGRHAAAVPPPTVVQVFTVLGSNQVHMPPVEGIQDSSEPMCPLLLN
eukprot:1154475-Pelagomonas_calceolata.AAC.10